jgi:UDP-glucose/iron transport system ATP-binding protein
VRVLFELHEVGLRRAGREVLGGLSTGIPVGSTSIVGPSGSGKSTLLRLLNRLADPDRGTVLYRGRPLSEYDVLALRREVSLVPQLPALAEGTVRANIEYAAGLAGREPDPVRCLSLAGLDPSFGDRDVSRLSVGEQQRAMLARALVQEPRVLLLDEPTSALDEAARGAVEETLLRLRSELQISQVVVTHDPAQAGRLGEWVIRVEAGRAVDAGPVEEVLVA